jgi:hypothetical protein
MQLICIQRTIKLYVVKTVRKSSHQMLAGGWSEAKVEERGFLQASKLGRSHQLHQIWTRSDFLFSPSILSSTAEKSPSLAATDIEPRSLREARHDAGKAPDTRLRELQHPTAPNQRAKPQRPISTQSDSPIRSSTHLLRFATLHIPASACLQASCVTTASLELAGPEGSSDAVHAHPCHSR